jgi:hypothetical protein
LSPQTEDILQNELRLERLYVEKLQRDITRLQGPAPYEASYVNVRKSKSGTEIVETLSSETQEGLAKLKEQYLEKCKALVAALEEVLEG